MLRFQEVDIGYKDKPLVYNINLEVYKGTLISILGRNGSGKSTLAQTILGNLKANKGTISINSNAINDLNVREIAQYISAVFTSRPQVDYLTVSDILNNTAQLFNATNSLVSNIAEKCEIEHLLSLKVNSLSDGEFQKVMIARAQVQNSPILILDEPTAFLDIINKKKIFELLQDLCSQDNKIIILISHEVSLALKYSDELWILFDNKINKYQNDDSNLKEEDILNLLTK